MAGDHSCPGVSSEQAGKTSSCAGCPNQQTCASGTARQPDPALPAIQANLEAVRHRILVLSGKGGVGKSFVCAMLAQRLCSEYRVGVLDVDLCGPSQARIFNCEGQALRQTATGWSPVYTADGISLISIAFLLDSDDTAVILRGDRKQGLIKQFLRDVNFAEDGSPLDFLLVDTPPGTSDEHLALIQLIKPITGAVLVTTPQEVAWQDVRKEIDFCRRTRIPILGVVNNMAGGVRCGNCGHVDEDIFPATGVADYARQHGIPYLGSLPIDSSIGQSCDQGVSLSEMCPPELLESFDTVAKNMLINIQ